VIRIAVTAAAYAAARFPPEAVPMPRRRPQGGGFFIWVRKDKLEAPRGPPEG
jgi:hypothetical protein